MCVCVVSIQLTYGSNFQQTSVLILFLIISYPYVEYERGLHKSYSIFYISCDGGNRTKLSATAQTTWSIIANSVASFFCLFLHLFILQLHFYWVCRNYMIDHKVIITVLAAKNITICDYTSSNILSSIRSLFCVTGLRHVFSFLYFQCVEDNIDTRSVCIYMFSFSDYSSGGIAGFENLHLWMSPDEYDSIIKTSEHILCLSCNQDIDCRTMDAFDWDIIRLFTNSTSKENQQHADTR